MAQLIAVVDGGVARPLARAVPGSAAGLRFGQLCLRKLYVLASRGGEGAPAQGCLLQVRGRTAPEGLREPEDSRSSHRL